MSKINIGAVLIDIDVHTWCYMTAAIYDLKSFLCIPNAQPEKVQV